MEDPSAAQRRRRAGRLDVSWLHAWAADVRHDRDPQPRRNRRTESRSCATSPIWIKSSRGEDPLAQTPGDPFYDAKAMWRTCARPVAGYTVRSSTRDDRTAIDALILREWGAMSWLPTAKALWLADHPGFWRCVGDAIIGLVTYRLLSDSCEVLVLNSWSRAWASAARCRTRWRPLQVESGKARLTVVTTNDTLLRLYQRYGMHMAALRSSAVERSRSSRGFRSRGSTVFRSAMKSSWN
ncbi:MAG: hypothetical protein R2838_25865 [Caldilineaceae bacterium]